LPNLWKSGLEIAEKAASNTPRIPHRIRPQGEGKSLPLSFENLVEAELRLVSHGIDGVDKRARFWTARAYSRQTSWGASWT